MPFHAREVAQQLGRSRRIIVVENNQSGQFARAPARRDRHRRQRPRPQVRRRAVRAEAHRRRGKGNPGGAKGDRRSAVHRTRLAHRAPDRRRRAVGRAWPSRTPIDIPLRTKRGTKDHDHPDADSSEETGGQGFQGGRAAGLVPRLRRLRRAERPAEGVRRAGDFTAPATRGVRHRLLVQPAGLLPLLRRPQPARPGAAVRHGGAAGEPELDGRGRRRRRRRLRHRPEPLHPGHAPQHQHHLHRDEQRDLRSDNGPDIADERDRHGHQERAGRQPGRDAQPGGAGPGGRLRLHRPRLQRRPEAPAPAVQGRHPPRGLRADRRVQPVRDVQQAQHLPLVPRPRLPPGGRRPRPDRLPRGDGQGARSGGRRSRSACSTTSPELAGRRWTPWTRPCRGRRWSTGRWG